MKLLVLLVIGLVGCGGPSAAQRPASPAGGASAAGPAAPDRADIDQDDAMWKMVIEGVGRLKAGKPEEAITSYFDKVIASYQERYATDKRHIYCGHDQAETLLYMLDAANKHEEAIALRPTWAEAWYYKSYALTEMHRTAEAVSALDKALALSPNHAHYLSERGHLYQLAKDWKHALELFTAAEESVKLMSDQKAQIDQRTRALRGQGYSLVELGDLDAAEKKYQESLRSNPDDAASKQELDYIKSLRPKRK